MVERYLDAVEVGGSIPPAPTIIRFGEGLEEVSIRLEGRELKVKKGSTVLEVLKEKFPSRLKKSVAIKINGDLRDLTYRIQGGEDIELVPIDSPEGLSILRHSASHIMAQAVKELFDGVKVAIGPATKDGFYYDFDTPRPFSDEDLEKIEERMREIVKKDLPFERIEMSRDEAIRFFEERGENYKVEILKEIGDGKVSLYRQGGFVDLCKGPHVPSTSYIKAFKLLSVSGAYWRGDERNPMLQRIYGTAFPKEKDLKEYLQRLEEAKRRDHRKLGRELELFAFYDEIGPGLPLYLPKGALVRYLLEEFLRREHLKRGYQFVVGPMLLKSELWKKSGHYDHYKEFMYFTEVDGVEYGIKPMNCIGHIFVYRSKVRSYRDLPLRFFELGCVHRHEKSGVLHGLLRVREFTQDDAHIFLREDQIKEEIKNILSFVVDVLNLFGFSYEMSISTRPEEYIGTEEMWEKATNALKDTLEELGVDYGINEGEGAFYGPKIDVELEDALGRKWQCATIQCDFALPERFDLTYVGSDGKRYRPVMLHRVVIGAIERFFGILIEHFAGHLPLWLSPEQVRVLTVTNRVDDYAREVYEFLKERGVRVGIDLGSEKLSFKVRSAQVEKVPLMLILGDKEKENRTVSVREKDGSVKHGVSLEDFYNSIKDSIGIPSL